MSTTLPRERVATTPGDIFVNAPILDPEGRPVDIETMKADYNRHRKAALDVCEKAKTEDRNLTTAESREVDSHVKEAKELQPKIQEAERGIKAFEMLEKAQAAMAGKSADGQRETHPWTRAMLTGSSQGAFGTKGLTGGGQGVVQVDRWEIQQHALVLPAASCWRS